MELTMSTLKSPGQKKKEIARVITFIMFFIITGFAYMGVSYVNTKSIDWTKNHIETIGSITNLNWVEEEYRSSKRRTSTRDIYQITYTFQANGMILENTQKIDGALFSELSESDPVTIWYADDDIYTNNLKSNLILRKVENNSTNNIISVLPFTLGGTLFIYYLMSFLFVRESKNSLPEGFYTESTWLDVDDNYLVAIDGNDLVFFDIDKKQSNKVQKLYQKNTSLEEMIAVSKSSKFNRIPISEINEVSSRHNSDTITIEHKEKTHSVEFLNQALKAHALDRIKLLIPSNLSHKTNEKTRIQAALPAIILAIILSSAIYFSSIFIINIIIGFLIITKVVPTIISRLLDPTITEEWTEVITS
jgi:hypothetical protein